MTIGTPDSTLCMYSRARDIWATVTRYSAVRFQCNIWHYHGDILTETNVKNKIF